MTRRILLGAGIFLLAASSCGAQTQTFTLTEPESRLSFEGSSPLHGFTGTTTAMSGTLSGDWDAGALAGDATVRIPVASLKTGNDARDHAVQHTTRMARNSDIVFTLKSAKPAPDAVSGWRRYRLNGMLEVGGVSKEVELDARARREDKALRVEAETVLTMSQFGLKPPSIARVMGLRDGVKVHFDTVWTPEKSDA